MSDQLFWRTATKQGWFADVANGRFVVRDATIWLHSRVVKAQSEAVFIRNDGTNIHIGLFTNGREAMDACEQAHKSRWDEDMEAGAIG